MAKCFTCPSFRHKTGRHLYQNCDWPSPWCQYCEGTQVYLWCISRSQWNTWPRRSNGRFPRHQAANETIRRALVSGGVPSILEPVGVCREDAKQPDGMTLIPWEDGRPLLWDFTSCNTLAQSHRARAERGPGVVANFAEDQKCCKYASLTPSYIFAPVCIESLGAWGDNAKAFIRKIGRRVKEVSGEPRSTSFLIQRLALEVQRGNATSVLGTIPASRDWSEVGLLPT